MASLVDQIAEAKIKKEGEVVPAESAAVVQGGPLDPSSPEGQDPEGVVVTPPPATPQKALYTGLTGELKTPEELAAYTKQVEEMLVQSRANQPAPNPVTPVPAAAPQDAKTRFAEVLFSKPEDAFEIAVSEATRRIDEKKAAADSIQAFWKRFYDENPDLKRLDNVVQSVRMAKANELHALKSETEVKSFLSTETRKLVDNIKRESSVKETVLPSGGAPALGGSREPVATPPAAPAKPLNFTDQIRQLKPGGRK